MTTTHGTTPGFRASMATMHKAPKRRRCEVMLAFGTTPVGVSRAPSGRADTPGTQR